MKSIAVAVILGMLAFVAPAQAVDLCDCKGYSGPGGPCYAGPGGPAYAGGAAPAMRVSADRVTPGPAAICATAPRSANSRA
jgi:hypothetical protein